MTVGVGAIENDFTTIKVKRIDAANTKVRHRSMLQIPDELGAWG